MKNSMEEVIQRLTAKTLPYSLLLLGNFARPPSSHTSSSSTIDVGVAITSSKRSAEVKRESFVRNLATCEQAQVTEAETYLGLAILAMPSENQHPYFATIMHGCNFGRNALSFQLCHDEE